MKRSSRFYLKRLSYLFLFGIVAYAIYNYSMIYYGAGQLIGQLRIISNTRPIDELMADASVPDSIKQKLMFIDEVKRFAVDSLGLKPSKNYTTFYDQGGKPVLWTLTASEPYQIKAYQWKFPFLGWVSYKGYFNYEVGKEEENVLKRQGYDTDYDQVTAWSTLGWFRDPILSGMLGRSKGQLAELIIHELTHATVYLKSNVDLNENLATVCGEVGAIHFLSNKYGHESNELAEYLVRKIEYDRFSNFMLEGTRQLDSLYKLMNDSQVIKKKIAKDKLILDIVRSIDTVSFQSTSAFKKIFQKRLPNNAYFLNFIRYDAQKDQMQTELKEKYNGNIKDYLNSFIEN